jgi:hypothetical protein
MSSSLEASIQEIKDRQEIYDVLMRFCRALDRLDRELLESTYHPDAMDDHGIYVGPAKGFIDFILGFQESHEQRSSHMILNHYCEIEGDVAHAETYFLARSLNRAPPFYITGSGRYIDRFEKRNGRWAIAARICTVDLFDGDLDPNGDLGDGPYHPTARNRTDPSYIRPIRIDPARFTQ